MKQGRASYTETDKKREPSTTRMNPGGVSQIGEAIGNHITDHGSTGYHGDRMRLGAGYTAPKDEGRTTHRGGSQGRH